MTTQQKLLAGVGLAILLALAFFGGRYSRPARVEVREHTVTQIQTVTKVVDHDVVVTKIVHDVVESKNIQTRIEWRTAPNGKPEVVETITDLTKTSDHTDDARQSVSDHVADATTVIKIDATKNTITTYTRPNWSVAIMPGLNIREAAAGGLSGLTPAGLISHGVLGASIERRAFGPLFFGAWGNTSGAGGLTARVEF